MITTPCPVPGSERNRLPPKKRDSRQIPPEHAPHAATFKVPFPYKSQGLKRQSGPKAFTSAFTDHPRPAPTQTFYQPWAQSPAPARAQPLIPIPIRQDPGWAEWSELYHGGSVHPGWELPFVSTGQPAVSGYGGVRCPPAPPLDHHQHPKLKHPDMCGLEEGYRWQSPPAFVELQRWRTERQVDGEHRGPYRRRRDCASQSQRIHGGFPDTVSAPVQLYQQETSLVPLPGNPQKTTASAKCSVSGHSSLGLVGVASSHQLPDRRVPVAERKVTGAFTPLSHCSPSNSPSPAADQHPWLLPHFAAGSLIELGDGRLRRVEDLQTEDFLVGALACPELSLSCCTVQSIRSSLSLSRLLLLVHEQDTQELVDVYVEYPFFVRGRGWSSCCPQRTSRLCGLRCHQLSVGDVCLALTPLAPAERAQSQPASQEPLTLAGAAGGERRPPPRSLQPVLPTLPTVPFGLTGGRTDSTRKRRWSAPEARGVGTDRSF